MLELVYGIEVTALGIFAFLRRRGRAFSYRIRSSHLLLGGFVEFSPTVEGGSEFRSTFSDDPVHIAADKPRLRAQLGGNLGNDRIRSIKSATRNRRRIDHLVDLLQ